MDDPMPDWIVPNWTTFLSEKRRPCNDGTFQELFDTDLMPLQRRAEITKMINLLLDMSPPVRTIMEIGTDRGTTFYHWLRAFPNLKKAVGVEIRGVPFARLFEKAFPDVQFLWVPSSSYAPSTVAKVREFLGEDKLDYLFIDGDKSHFDTDFWLYRPMMADTGLMAMHDVFDNNSPMQNAYLNTSVHFTKRMAVIDHSDRDRLKERELVNPGFAKNSYQDWLRHWSYTSCGYGCVIAGSGPVTKP